MAKRLAQNTSDLHQILTDVDLQALRVARAKEMDSWGKAALKVKTNLKTQFGVAPTDSGKDSDERSE